MKIYDYAIIGGGISGLLCGHLLKDFVILEKENEIGGRTRSTNIGNIKVDIGAQFISNSLVRKLEKICDVKPFLKVEEPSTVFVVNNKMIIYKNFLKFLLNLPINWKKKIGFVWDIIKLYSIPSKKLNIIPAKQFLRNSTLDILRPVVLGLTSENPEDLSSSYIKFLFKNMTERIQTNIYELISYLEKNLKDNIIYNANVSKISDKDNHFEIYYSKNKKHDTVIAKKVIFTIPADEIVTNFSNIIDEKKILTLKKIRYSSCVVISVKIKKQFPFFIYFMDKGPIWSLVNFSSIGKNIINLFITGPETNDFINMDENKIKKYAINFLTSENSFKLPISRNDIEDINIINWKKCLPICDTDFISFKNAFEYSIDDRIFFCGDYSDIPSVEGCIRSVERVINQIKNI